VTPKNEPMNPKDKIGKCLDHWQLELKLTELGLLEGNQKAIETFRNNMTVEGSPKPDPAMVTLIRKIEEVQRIKSLQ
jgi:hypothetical protein